MAAKTGNSDVLVVRRARVSFTPSLFALNPYNQAPLNPGQKQKFWAHFIIPRDHEQLPEVKARIMQAATEMWGPQAGPVVQALSATDKFPLRNGDLKEHDGYPGNLFIVAKSAVKPSVFKDVNGVRVAVTEDDGSVYSGCYVDVSLTFQAGDYAGKYIAGKLRGVRFAEDGDPLAGGRPADADEFGEVQGSAEATAEFGDLFGTGGATADSEPF